MRTLIVDDDPRSLQAFKELLTKNHPDVEIIATGGSVEEGCKLIRQHQPEVVFLDVQLPDGLGFDILKRLDTYDFQVVFITAHNEYAVTAFKFEALDYLLKPVPRQDLADTLQKIRQKMREKISREQVQTLLETFKNFEIKRLPSRIAIPTSQGTLYRGVKNIIRLQAQQNFTEFFILEEKKRIIASTNIGEYVDQFEQYPIFMKVHRSHLVNLRFVNRFVRGERSFLEMNDGSIVSVARAYRDELLDRLNSI